jgi:hypothetical protein
MKKLSLPKLSIFVMLLGLGCGQDTGVHEDIFNLDGTQLGDLSSLDGCDLPDNYKVMDPALLLSSDADAACANGGKTVMIRATAKMETPMCTAMACDEYEPCCNSCRANFGLGDDTTREFILIKNGTDIEIGCQGDECGNMYCDGLKDGADYVFWGTFDCEFLGNLDGNNRYARNLTIVGFCEL